MDTSEAWGVLGLAPGASRAEVRTAYLALLRALHPDHAGGSDVAAATTHTATVTQAYAIVIESLDRADAQSRSTARPDHDPTREPFAPAHANASSTTGAVLLGNDSIAIDAPAAEAYVLLYEAASNVGEIAYYDQQLGILEMIVRFVGGPSCSVVMTMQGRATYTEVLCTMVSIEAVPAPPMRPVLEALLEKLGAVQERS